ncbi:MAG: universal stress protein [Pelobium sp.]
MKTIAVLTDFSKVAENAAKYAMHLAVHLNANIKLYHSFFVATEHPVSAGIVWPVENYKELKLDSMRQLELLGAELKKESSKKITDDFKPQIECQSHEGDFTSFIKAIQEEKDLVLLVMGNHEENTRNWLKDNHVNNLMDKVSLPVLIISEDQKPMKIDKIAFATDLNMEDVVKIHSLAGLARAFHSEILVVHVVDGKYNEQELKEKEDELLGAISSNLDFPKVYYRRIKSSDAEHGLDWFKTHGQIDMLVMVHRHHTFLQELFGGSVSKEMAKKVELPLLIYPVSSSVPFF